MMILILNLFNYNNLNNLIWTHSVTFIENCSKRAVAIQKSLDHKINRLNRSTTIFQKDPEIQNAQEPEKSGSKKRPQDDVRKCHASAERLCIIICAFSIDMSSICACPLQHKLATPLPLQIRRWWTSAEAPSRKKFGRAKSRVNIFRRFEYWKCWDARGIAKFPPFHRRQCDEGHQP